MCAGPRPGIAASCDCGSDGRRPQRCCGGRSPAPPTLRVVRTTTDLASGAIVRSGDVTVSPVAEDALPRGALVDASAVVGRRVGPAAEGQVLTALDLSGTSWGSGRVT